MSELAIVNVSGSVTSDADGCVFTGFDALFVARFTFFFSDDFLLATVFSGFAEVFAGAGAAAAARAPRLLALLSAFLAAAAAFRALRAALLAFFETFFAFFRSSLAWCVRFFASAAARSADFCSRWDASAVARAVRNVESTALMPTSVFPITEKP